MMIGSIDIGRIITITVMVTTTDIITIKDTVTMLSVIGWILVSVAIAYFIIYATCAPRVNWDKMCVYQPFIERVVT